MDKEEKLLALRDKLDERTGGKSEKTSRASRIEEMVRELADEADLKKELRDTRITFRTGMENLASKFSSLSGIADAIKGHKIEIPREITAKVTNLKDIPKTVVNIPTLFDVRKPIWIDTITSPIKAVNSKMDQVVQAIKNVKLSEDPEKPIAVRLSDGKKFYEAITQVFGGTAGNIINIPKVTLSGGQQAIPVVNPDGTNILGVTGIAHGVKTVTTAGTDVALAGSTACKKVTIQSQTDNTGLIAVGGSGVDATVATGTGVILFPGDVFELEIDNLADIYIDSSVSGEGVRYTYFT